LGTSTHPVPSRIVSQRVVRCRPVFHMANLNWRKKNPAYAPLSVHSPRFEYGKVPDRAPAGRSAPNQYPFDEAVSQYPRLTASPSQGRRGLVDDVASRSFTGKRTEGPAEGVGDRTRRPSSVGLTNPPDARRAQNRIRNLLDLPVAARFVT